MRFLASVLTLHHSTPQPPLRFAEWRQLRQDVATALFSTDGGHGCLLTVTCLSSDQQRIVLRLTFVEAMPATALAQLLRRLDVNEPVHLCQRHSEIGMFEISDPIWTGISTWADVQATPYSAAFRLIFATPLLTAAPETHEALNALPFPEPITLLAQATQHWQHLTGVRFPYSPLELVQASGCVLSTYALRTVDIPSATGMQIGYLGWMEYTCLHSQTEESAAIAALARLAFFTGWGYESACGFGTARVVFRKRGE